MVKHGTALVLLAATFWIPLQEVHATPANTLQMHAAARRAARMSLRPRQQLQSIRQSVAMQPSKKRQTSSKQSLILDRRLKRIRMAVIDRTNEERISRGLTPFIPNTLLERSAQAYAEDMHTRNFFTYESPEGTTPGDRIREIGYGNLTAENCDCLGYRIDLGENLAHGQRTVERVVEDWMNSPKHREAILNEHFQEIGIGISGTYWVQHFGGLDITYRD